MAEIDRWALERACWARGIALVCGCDEAGAGPLAGAVYAGAVILPPECSIEGLNDSKQVTPKRRDALYDTIRTVAVAWAVARVEAEEIDATDILSARIKAMQMAIDRLEPAPGFALIDGNRDHGKTAAILLEHQTVVKGDSLSASIAAASILAKVSRDRYMEQMAERYPEYEFERHKGYGTKRHYELLRRYGPCPIHRRSPRRRRASPALTWRRSTPPRAPPPAAPGSPGLKMHFRGSSRWSGMQLICLTDTVTRCFCAISPAEACAGTTAMWIWSVWGNTAAAPSFSPCSESRSPPRFGISAGKPTGSSFWRSTRSLSGKWRPMPI